MDSANKRTSSYFAAKLGVLDPAVAERLERWATASCIEYVLRRHADACATLYAARSSAKTARQYQSLLLTHASHWKMSFGTLERGWLALLSEGEYKAAVQCAAVCAQPELNDSHEVGLQNGVRTNWVDAPTQPVSGEGVKRTQQLTDPTGCVMLFALSEGFDERAQALYNNLLAVH